MKAKIYVGAKKYALYIGRKIVEKTLEFLTLPARFVSKKVQDLKNLTMWGQSVQNGTPTPTAPVEIESVGDKSKNLFDKTKAIVGTLGYSTGNTGGDKGYVSDFIPVEEGKKYIISGILNPITSLDRIAGYYADKTYAGTSTWNSTDKAYTVKPNVKYIRFCMGDGTNLDTVQFEEGTIATSYEPYGYKVPVVVGNTTTNIYLNEPLRKIGEYADTMSVDGTNVAVVRNVYFQTDIYTNPSVSSGRYLCNADVEDISDVGSTTIALSNLLQDGSIYSYSELSNVYNYIAMYRNSNYVSRIVISRISECKTVEDFQNILKGIEIYYPLATPTTETYTIESPIQLPQGTLTIDTDTNIKPSKINITGDIDNE